MKHATTHRLLNIAVAIVLVLALAYFWPDADVAHSASQKAAIAEQGEAFRLAKAAKEICKEKAAWTLIDSRVIQCFAEVREVAP